MDEPRNFRTVSIDVGKIMQIKNAFKNNKIDTYNTIYKQINDKITFMLKFNPRTNNIVFEVPLFMIGFPTYPLDECINYLLTKLANDGFTNLQVFGNKIRISLSSQDLNTQTHFQFPEDTQSCNRPTPQQPQEQQDTFSVVPPTTHEKRKKQSKYQSVGVLKLSKHGRIDEIPINTKTAF